MKIIRLSTSVVSIAALILVVTNTSFVQSQDATPTPTVSPSPEAQTTPTPTPTPSPSASESPSASPTTTPAVGGSADKEKVLGAATKLGSTSRSREIAKWFLASAFGLLALLIGLKVLRSNVEE